MKKKTHIVTGILYWFIVLAVLVSSIYAAVVGHTYSSGALRAAYIIGILATVWVFIASYRINRKTMTRRHAVKFASKNSIGMWVGFLKKVRKGLFKKRRKS